MLKTVGAGRAEAVPALLKFLRDCSGWRQSFLAAEALSAIGSPAIPPLVHAVEHGCQYTRYYAATALKLINQTPHLAEAIEFALRQGDGSNPHWSEERREFESEAETEA